MNHSTTFPVVINRLLAAEVICESSTKGEEFLLLKTEAFFNEVDRYLNKINLKLKETPDGSGFYAAYLDASGHEIEIRRYFREDVMHSLQPLVGVLQFIKSAQQKDRPLRPGDTLNISEIIEAVERSGVVLQDELDYLSRSNLFKNTKKKTSEQVEVIVKRLVQHQYLVERSGRPIVYIATGKWSLVYEMIAYINDHQNSEDSDAELEDAQGEFF